VIFVHSHYIDLSISGINGARNGTLTFMVGGNEKVYKSSLSILEKMGSKSFYCGPAGAGQVAKICNNMLLGISMAGLCEALVLGKKLGLDPETLLSIINASSGRCWSSELYSPIPDSQKNLPACRDYEGGFSTSLLVKDLSLAQASGREISFQPTVGAHALAVFKELSQHENFGKKDFSSLYKFLVTNLKNK